MTAKADSRRSPARDRDAAGKRRVPLTVNRPELLVDGTDDQFREMVHNALAFSVRLQAIRDGYARYIDLSGVQYTILISIGHLQGDRDIGVSEIAEHLSLSGTFVTTETRKLVSQGLLTKETSKADRRRVCLKLTDKSWELLEKLSEIQSDINDAHFAPLTARDFLRFSTLMKELSDSTDRALLILEHHVRLKEADSK